MTDVSNCQIKPFRSGRWNNMSGITCEKQPAILHRFDDKAAHRQDAFLSYGPHAQLPVTLNRQAELQLFEDHLIRPIGNIVLWVALNIHTLQFWRACADQGKTSVRIGIYQFIGRGRSLHQNPEPSKGIGAAKHGLYRLWKRGSSYTVKAITSRDEIALQLALLILVYKL